jgi:hypothetical protein
MKLLKIGEKTVNLDMLAYYEEIVGAELHPDYEPRFDSEERPIDPVDSDYIETLRIELFFSGRDKPLRLEMDESREFLHYVSLKHGVEWPARGLPQQENPEG